MRQIVLDKVGICVDQFRILKGLMCKSKDTVVLSSADLLIELCHRRDQDSSKVSTYENFIS